MTEVVEQMTKRMDALPQAVEQARETLGRPLTYAEKVLFAHLYHPDEIRNFARGTDYVAFRPDRVAMQDATAQMALLQFMNAGQETSAVPTTVHCDHLIEAHAGAAKDLADARSGNAEVYDFLQQVCDKYGLGFWKPGGGIIHQTVLENYAFPGGMMVGTDSHTPNAGGLGMVAIGVGGADAVDVMTGMEWELKMPKLIGVELTGELSGWSSPKDVILKLAGLLTVKGGTDAIIEYFGSGAASLSASGKGTICNMGAEVGATCSIFAYDANMGSYLRATNRDAVADLADSMTETLSADPEVLADPESYFDQVIRINLSELEPQLNGPFTPDAATPLSQVAEYVEKNGFPETMEVGLIGSCTNSSYQDMARAASVAAQVISKRIPLKAQLMVTPGTEMVRRTVERDGILDVFNQVGATVLANACGPCIGQWNRVTDDNERRNSVVHSFNRNFAKRVDGNPNTHAFVASPEVTVALAIAGDLGFNPITDTLTNADGEQVKLDPPTGDVLPRNGFLSDPEAFIAPTGATKEVTIDPESRRLQKLTPFPAWDGGDFEELTLLIKAQGKCTTDHISMAGPWLRFRGHLDNISGNLLMGAVNAFNGRTNSVLNRLTGTYDPVSATAKGYKDAGISSIIVGEENYGEGSSREHAAMEPRNLNAKVVLVKSFARIHETNLKKQGMLALRFADPADYDKIREDDRISVLGLRDFAPDVPLTIRLHHSDGTTEDFQAIHSYNDQQIEWFKAGSALNFNALQAA
jgi:aconitate hydratase